MGLVLGVETNEEVMKFVYITFLVLSSLTFGVKDVFEDGVPYFIKVKGLLQLVISKE